MVDFSDIKEERERIIFQLFAEAAHLPVIPGSIRSKRPPAPDIFCEIQKRGPVAFELVEIVTPALVRETETSQKLEQAFKTACEKRSEVAARFQNALIYVGFLKGIPFQQRISVVSEVVDELFRYSENSAGYIEVPRKLQKVLVEISVTRGVSSGPAFNVMEATECTEEIFEQVEKKCTKKKYLSAHPIELLAFYINQPSSNGLDWQSEFHDYVLKILPGCQFERVWVYDNLSKEIKYVHPGLDKGIKT